MYIDTTVYDWSMTLVIANICEDGIAICADGRALMKHDNSFISDDEVKLMKLGDKVYWAMAIDDIYKGELEKINKALQYIIKLEPPYTLSSVANHIGGYMKHYYTGMSSPPHFSLILAGYDKPKTNSSLNPQLLLISDSLNFGWVSLPTVAVGVFNQPEIENKIPKTNTVAAVKFITDYINKISLTDKRVGGKILSAIIKP